VARPSKLSPEVTERIVQAIRAGNYAEAACQSAGIGTSTFYRWMAQGAKEPASEFAVFRDEVVRAEAEAEVHAVAIMRRAMGGDWRAALAYLERRHAARWRPRHQTEIVGRQDGPGDGGLDLSKLSDAELATLEELTSRAAIEDEH
jgi:hypothetical protein